MTRYRPPSIRDKGLEQFLELTKSKHNGYGYQDFVKLYKADVTLSSMGRAFKVSRQTIENWLQVYKEEQDGS
jgi:helix-turn-helix protein